MDFHIRPATLSDIAPMHRIRLAVAENRLSGAGRVTEASYRPYVECGSAWLAEAAGEILGFVIVDAPARSLWALFVHPDLERRGIARALFETATRWATQRRLGSLWLVTSPGTRAEAFYRAAGLTRTGVTEEGEVRFELTLGEAGPAGLPK